MSDTASMAIPSLEPDPDDGTTLPELINLLVASGDLFYDWDLVDDTMIWTGDYPESLNIQEHGTLDSGDRFLSRIHPEDLPHRMISMSRHLERDDVFDHEYRVRDDTGNFVWIQERAIATKSGNGKPNRLTGIIRNVDARKKSEEEVTFLSNHDALTGQYNKLRLRESLEHVIAQSLLTQQPGGLLLVGIDKLNALSDVYGEESADTIVLAAARRIETSMRSGDVVGRVGYDRFAVIVENCSRSKLTIVAERFLSAIRDNPIATPAGAMTITASVGISVFPGDASTARDVVSHADNALRAARRLGCDCYLDYINVPEHARTERPELVIAEQAKQALKEDRFKLAFQPVVSARTGDVAFYEGLAENPGRSSAQSARSGFAAHSGDHRDRGPGRCR